LLACAYLALASALLGDYGPTWDTAMGEYPYGERLLAYLESGERIFLDNEATQPAPEVRQPHPDFDVGRFRTDQVFPFGALLSALSCRVLWTALGLVPAMAAHNLPIPLITAALLLLLVRFAAPRIGLAAAVTGCLLFLCAPRFFADTFNNLKDVPETCLYVAATVAGLQALTSGRASSWLAAGSLTGLGLAQKPNALFVPVQMGLFLALAAWLRPTRSSLCWSTRGFLLGSLAFLVVHVAVSPGYWTEPIAAPAALFEEILRVGNRGFDADAAEATVSGHALLFVWTTTPPLLLGLGLLGLLVRGPPAALRLFLALGLLVPIGRNLLPGMSHYGGVRHYLEFYPYLGLAAGIGLSVLAGHASRLMRGGALLRLALLVPAPAAALAQALALHPNGIAYFNSFLGGLDRAQALDIPGATDYWGNSYWQGLAWLSEHAEPDALLIAPIASHVVRCAAPVRLRADVELWASDLDRGQTIYVMYITRKGWYRPLIRHLEKNARPVYAIRVQGGTLLNVYRLGTDEVGRTARELWRREMDAKEEVAELVDWLRDNRTVLRELTRLAGTARIVGQEAALEAMRPLVPERYHGALAEAMWGRFAE
jgi:hypothetical protein